MKRYPAILAALYNTPQLITLAKLEEIAAFIESRESGVSIERQGDPAEPPTSYFAADSGELAATSQVPASGPTRQYVAVLPLFGTLYQHGDMVMDASGGTSTQAWSREFRRLDANPSVKSIVIETHSPGGQVYGTEETANLLRAARDAGRTRIVSVVNSEMASAALWIGTAASEVYVTPGGEMGSIGVVSMHRDFSRAEEQAGVKTTLIAHPPKKVEGHPYAPLDDEVHATLLDRNRETYRRFVDAMALNRRTTPEVVEERFGSGGMLKADEAVRAGLADGVATMDEVMEREVARLRKAGAKSMRNRAAIAALEI